MEEVDGKTSGEDEGGGVLVAKPETRLEIWLWRVDCNDSKSVAEK